MHTAGTQRAKLWEDDESERDVQEEEREWVRTKGTKKKVMLSNFTSIIFLHNHLQLRSTNTHMHQQAQVIAVWCFLLTWDVLDHSSLNQLIWRFENPEQMKLEAETLPSHCGSNIISLCVFSEHVSGRNPGQKDEPGERSFHESNKYTYPFLTLL